MKLKKTFEAVKKASQELILISDQKIQAILNDLAEHTRTNISYLINENKKDLDRMDPDDPRFDRLKLTEERIENIIRDIQQVAGLPSPLNAVLDQKNLDNGLELKKITVPLGTIGIIYEARPNVTFDVFALCLKSGNACILKGGSDAADSNLAIMKIIHQTLEQHQVDTSIVQLLPSSHEATAELLAAVGYVDIIIPRGSQRLIDFVRENARVPVIETGAGIVHTYFDEFADLEKGVEIINNAKTRRVSVCNALDCLIIHQKRLQDLPFIAERLAEAKVEIFADEKSYQILKDKYPANLLKMAEPHHFGTEFLAYKMAIKTTRNMNQALEHISNYSSKHSEAIISENKARVDEFFKRVDAAAVYANTSTAFTDGAQFGLGAEIGISTQKLHARGPMALAELTSYKWIIQGNGQIRP
ncbi:MAG: glutamate-5-semialdehyde dehydrogenase [Candidatus Cyclobacteriaceae bacterium M3_2C_046]